nr:CMF_HP1_G0006540.mRNA.1.CDS.1 [Saccharomyces cerevisiae]
MHKKKKSILQTFLKKEEPKPVIGTIYFLNEYSNLFKTLRKLKKKSIVAVAFSIPTKGEN